MHQNSADAARPSPYLALAGVTASVSVFAVAQGLSYPLFTFLMQKQGFPAGFIGLSAAMTPIGLVASAPFVPRAVARFGARGLAVGCASIAGVLFFLIGLLQNEIAWLALRFLVGVVINPLYILGEVWMIALAPPARRGRVMGLFNAITGVGYAAGPLALAWLGSDGWPPLLVGVAAFFGCALALFLTTKGLRGFEDDGEKPRDVWSMWAVAPALLLAVVISAAVQTTGYSLLPVFGAGHGLPEATIATLVTALSVGNIFLQVPLGLLAERIGARPLIIGCAFLNSACALTLPLLVSGPLIWPILLVMGGIGYGVYTMALVDLGNRFSGSTLVAGNAAFALMWGVGGIAGPPVVGLAMQGWGVDAMPIMIAALGFSLVAFTLYRDWRRGRT